MKYILAALCTAILLNLASPPVDFGLAASLMFLPLFPFFRVGPWKRFFTGWAAGFLIQALAYYWIFFTVRDFGGQSTTISVVGAVAFQLYQGLDLALWLLVAPMLCNKKDHWFLPVAAAACLVVIQGVVFPYVFPWDYGSLFANASFISGSAALWTSRGIAFFMIMIQGFVWLYWKSLKRKWPVPVGLACLLLSGHFFKTEVETDTWRIGVIQPNLVRWAKRGGMSYNDIFQAHFKPSLALMREELDLIVWPESAMAFPLEQFPHYQERLVGLVRDSGAGLIYGTIARTEQGGYRNEIHLLTPQSPQPQVYGKEKLVMFSESLPWVFSWARHFDPAMGAFEAGRNNKPFTFKGRTISPLVCFEALFPEYAGKTASDLVVNLTNDAWFGETKASSQHLQQIRLRAVEQRVPLLRATNSGITCWVDPSGRIRDAGGLYEAETFIYEAPIPNERPRSFSRIGGNLIYLMAWGAVLYGLVPISLGRKDSAGA